MEYSAGIATKGGSAGKYNGYTVKASSGSHNSINPIRKYEEQVLSELIKNANKRTDTEFIKLSTGNSFHSFHNSYSTFHMHLIEG